MTASGNEGRTGTFPSMRAWAAPIGLGTAAHVVVLFLSIGLSAADRLPVAPPSVRIRFAPPPSPPAPSASAVEAPEEPPPPPPPPVRKPRRRRPRPRKKPTPVEKPAVAKEAKEPVAEAAPAEVTRPVKPEKTAAPPPQAPPQVNLSGYWQGFLETVEMYKDYPRMARRLRLEGTVRIRVTIDRRGALIRTPEVVKSSGHEVLDREALRMLQAMKASGFSVPLPSGWSKPTASFVLPFQFRLRG